MNWWEILSNTIRTGIGSTVIIYALAAIGLNLHFGYTGLLNFGQVGFMAVGAYGVGIMTRTYGHPLWAGVLVGIAAGVVLALLLGLPTLRLRADYLAIVTIAAAEIIRLIVRVGAPAEVHRRIGRAQRRGQRVPGQVELHLDARVALRAADLRRSVELPVHRR